ncbi:MAG: nitroreductase [Faecousia sp.]|nr:nitroreductase [Bacillota bacterium]
MNEVLKCLQERRSCRSFLPKQLDEETLEAILTAGTFAASGRGRQAAKIVVLQKPEEIATLERMNAAVLGAPDAHPFFGAPTVCVVLADAEVSTAVEDGALVIGNLMTAAWSLGVGSCWVHRAREEFASDEGKKLLKQWGIEGNYIGVGHCVLGYPTGEFRPAAPRKANYVTRV